MLFSSNTKVISLLDDNFQIRFVLKKILSAKYRNNVKIFSSDNGLSGLGSIFVNKPDLIIVDTTLPKYAGIEVLEYIKTNEYINSKNTPVIVLSEETVKEEQKRDAVEKNILSNYIHLRKTDRNFLSQLLSEVDKIFSASEQKRKFSAFARFKEYLARDIINISNRLDRVISSLSKRSPGLSPIEIPYYIFLQISVSLYLTLFYILNGRKLKEENIEQEKKDLKRFRVRYYPTLATILGSIFFVFFQVALFVVGGLIVFESVKVRSIFADLSPEYNINLLNSEYDSSKFEIKIDGGIGLKRGVRSADEFIDENPNSLLETSPESDFDQEFIEETKDPLVAEPQEENSSPLNEEDPSVLGESEFFLPDGFYPTDRPAVVFKDPVVFDELISISSVVSLNDQIIVYPVPTTDKTYDEVEEFRLIQRNGGVSIQLSPDLVSWFYINSEGFWEKTEAGWVSSNTIETVSKNLSVFKEQVTDILQLPIKEVYVKAFFYSEGNTEVILKEIKFQREIEILSSILIPKQNELILDEKEVLSDIVVDYLNNQLILDSVSDGEEILVSNLPVPVIFQASYANGNKIIYGKLAENVLIPEEELSNLKVKVYYTTDSDLSANAAKQGEFIGESLLQVNQKGEYTFLVAVLGEPGGKVTAKLVYEKLLQVDRTVFDSEKSEQDFEKNNITIFLVSNLSRPLES